MEHKINHKNQNAKSRRKKETIESGTHAIIKYENDFRFYRFFFVLISRSEALNVEC